MILGEEDKPSLDVLAHHGVKGMKWGVRKQNQTSLSKIGDRLNKKHLPLTRSLVRNGAGWVAGQAAVGAVPTGAMMAAAGATQVASLIQSGISAGVTARDLAAIGASDIKGRKSKKK